MKSIQWMCSSNKCVFLTILIAAVCASRQVATAQRHSGLKFEISFPEGVHSGPITGRVYAIISRNSDREPRFQTGFLGRTGIFEVLAVGEELRDLIFRQTTKEVIRQVAIDLGMQTLKQSAVNKVLDGTTTVEEMYRVVSM